METMEINLVKQIKHNKIKCLKCGDIIESKAVHDYVVCSCESCAVDGGTEYLARTGDKKDWKELSEFIIFSPSD